MLFYKKYMILLMTMLLIIFVINTGKFSASASSGKIVSGISYELAEESHYLISDSDEKTELCYGEQSLGNLYLQGEINHTLEYNQFPAYDVNSEISFYYSYGGDYQTNHKETWNLCDSDEKTVNGTAISKKIKSGAVIIEESENAQNWETVSVMTNIFKKQKTGLITLYDAPAEEFKQGTYYRISVAYQMKQKVGEKADLFKTDVYAYKQFLEVYEFYIGYGRNPVVLKDVVTNETVSDSCENGFKIDKCGINCTVKLKKDNEPEQEISDKTSFYEQVNYLITVINNLNQTYQQEVQVTRGLAIAELTPNMHESEKKGKYEDVRIVRSPVFGEKTLTTLKIAQQSNQKIVQEREGKFYAYGLNAEGAELYLHLQSPYNKNWSVTEDEWGKKESQTIKDVWPGTVGTGTVIIQKSMDGANWVNLDMGKYASGLYTTDYFRHYGNQGDILLYMPNGKEIQKGLHLRIIYAYQLYQESTKEKRRFIEEYYIYLCSNDFNAVTFHNLSVDDEQIQERIGEDSEIDMTLARKMETLLSGSCTVSGFSVDTELNPTVKVSASRNGNPVEIPESGEFTETGKYIVHLESAVHDTKDITLYVDRQTGEESLKTYFGDRFLTGKRIYSEGEYPVYEGGRTEYHLNAADENFLPVHGTITNQTTGRTIQISAGSGEQNTVLHEAGKYTAVLTNRPVSTKSEEFPGDYRTFTFEFELIEKGTAPGPVVNQRNLKKYVQSNISDVYPMYYALTYPSTSKGNITLAFASWRDARRFSYQYEKGMVEKQKDGSFRYTGSSSHIQKKIYDEDDYTDAVNFFAEQAIQELYFDMTDEFTYRTLQNDSISEIDSLRELKLAESVTVFAPGQKQNLCPTNTLPNISKKKYLYLFPGKSGSQRGGYHDFQFIQDKYRCDSASVVITESDGQQHRIAYHQGVAEQLKRQKCKSGIVTITEKTIYGDSVKYQAVYIAENDNTAEIRIRYALNGKTVVQSLTKKDQNFVIQADSFSIIQVTDELEPYNLITVYNKTTKEKIQFAADNIPETVWADTGDYQVTVANRLGYAYSFTVSVNSGTKGGK